VAQRPKAHVRAAILESAVEQFAEVGFARATLATIARRARTSIGNLYKYFADKDALFAAAIPPVLVAKLKKLFRARMRAVGTERDVGRLAAGHPYRVAADALLEFSFLHRQEVLFLFGSAAGTRFASFREELERELVRLALVYGRRAHPAFDASPVRRRTLARIYHAYLSALVAVLREESSERSAIEASGELVRYHLGGLRAFFEAGASKTPETST
jgi:AcrR family transcriptional regulator